MSHLNYYGQIIIFYKIVKIDQNQQKRKNRKNQYDIIDHKLNF